MKPKKSKQQKSSAAYPLKYDTVYDSRTPKMQRLLRSKLTLYDYNKEAFQNNPEFASTDAQHFASEYEKNFKKKLSKQDQETGWNHKKYKPFDILPLNYTENPDLKDNAGYSSTRREFVYNGKPYGSADYYPHQTLAEVIAHEKGHQLDDSYRDDLIQEPISSNYTPFVDNNYEILNMRKFGHEDRANAVAGNSDLAYSIYNTYHDSFPSEMFADLIADKYTLTSKGIYNALDNAPFGKKHLQQYKRYLQNLGRTGGWNRLMKNLVDPKYTYVPSEDIYIKAMNDL